MKIDKETLMNSVSDIDPYSRTILSVSVDVSNSGRAIAQVIPVNTRLSDAIDGLSKVRGVTRQLSKKHSQKVISSPNAVVREAPALSRMREHTNQIWQQHRSNASSLRSNRRCRNDETGGIRCLK